MNVSLRSIEVNSLLGFREPWSSFSHLLGAVVFVALAVVLIRRGRGDWLRTASLAIMAFASVQLLLLSGLYHMLWPGPMRQFMVRADISAVFMLIAGCMTPVHVILFRGVARWAPLAIAWGTAFAGILLRMVFFESVSNEVGIAIFLLFGWSCAVTAMVLLQRFGWKFVQLAVWQGMAYTLGAMALMTHRPILLAGIIGPHELWHMTVLCGLGLHWGFVFQFASGNVPAPVPRVASKVGTLAQA